MKKNKEDAGVNADAAIRSLDTKISESIMRAMQKGKDIDAKVGFATILPPTPILFP
jgi:hypothetical protein